MNDTNIYKEIPNYILAQTPVLLASLGGLIVALRLWRKAPAASLWAAGAFALGMFNCALVGVGQAVGSDATTHFVGPILRAATYVLLLIGVYAGRTSSPATLTGSPESVWQNVRSTIRARPGLRAVSFVLFISVFLVVVVITTLGTFILPESFVSQARVVLRPSTPDAVGTNAHPGAAGGFDPRLIKTECEVIQSEAILGKAIEDLDLDRDWGKRYANGDRLKTSECMTLLRARMDLRPVPDTSIIEIRVYDEKPDGAAKVANAIAEAYRDHINSPGTAASASREAHVEMPGMPAPASKPVQRDSAKYLAFGPPLEILDHAVPSYRPVRPNKPLNITLGVLMGLVLGLVVGAGAWWVGLQVGKQPGLNPQS
jgi:capsular polysaccharide biosynthesis protein